MEQILGNMGGGAWRYSFSLDQHWKSGATGHASGFLFVTDEGNYDTPDTYIEGNATLSYDPYNHGPVLLKFDPDDGKVMLLYTGQVISTVFYPSGFYGNADFLFTLGQEEAFWSSVGDVSQQLPHSTSVTLKKVLSLEAVQELEKGVSLWKALNNLAGAPA
jgi:hypothetical protein